MPKKICIINMKGGVGKSTLAVQLAWHFAAYPNWMKRVLVIDNDPQFNASQYLLGIDRYRGIAESGHSTIWNLYNPLSNSRMRSDMHPKDAIVNVAKIKDVGQIDLIPSQPALSAILKNPEEKVELLANSIKEIESDYDLILIDCPPTESLFTFSAYLASNYVLIPVKPEFLSTIGLPLIKSSLDKFSLQYSNHNLELAGVVFNSITNNGSEELLAKEEVRNFADSLGWYVFKNEVRYSRMFPNSSRLGKPIFWTPHTRSQNLAGFYLLADELAKRLEI
jgi:chromosome partitioning protein